MSEKRYLCAVCGMALSVLVAPVPAATIGFQINQAQSHFSLSGVFRHATGGISPIAQSISGSLDTGYTGTILTDSDLSTIVFMGGAIDALPGGMFAPGPAEGDYGLRASLPLPEGNLLAAIREFSFELNGLANPLFSGFDLSAVTATAASGAMESTTLPNTPLTGATAIVVAGTGTLFESGDQRTLSLPLTLAFAEPIPGTDYSLEFTLSGMVVATRTIPEPGSAALLCAGAALVGLRRREHVY